MNKEEKNYTKKLEEVIKQMITPIKRIPFKLVIESLSGHKVISFNKKNTKDKSVLQTLIKVSQLSSDGFNQKRIKRNRPNEIGNDIEPIVKKNLNALGYHADTPRTNKQQKKSTGYPDIEFVDKFGRINYVECKTYHINNIATTQRSFFLSPSNDFKITKDAHHFVISFEIEHINNSYYVCRSWKILTLENLEVDVKYEFNSDNQRLYSHSSILAEGQVT